MPRSGHFDSKAAKRFFEAAPPHASEQLETETHLVLDWLIECAGATDDEVLAAAAMTSASIAAIALTPHGDVKGSRTIDLLRAASSRGKKGEAAKKAKKVKQELEQLLRGATLIVHASLAGLTEGLLDSKASAVVEVADDESKFWLARSDPPDVPVTSFRVRYCRTAHPRPARRAGDPQIRSA